MCVRGRDLDHEHIGTDDVVPEQRWNEPVVEGEDAYPRRVGQSTDPPKRPEQKEPNDVRVLGPEVPGHRQGEDDLQFLARMAASHQRSGERRGLSGTWGNDDRLPISYVTREELISSHLAPDGL
jgi:hypothetical protein